MIIKALSRQCFIIKVKNAKEEIIMLKLLAKVAEKYAKSTNTACWIFGAFHQPKMPASLIKKD
jgi:cyclic lactone autoinducer peptide